MAFTAKDVQIVAAGLHDCCKMLDNMLWQHLIMYFTVMAGGCELTALA